MVVIYHNHSVVNAVRLIVKPENLARPNKVFWERNIMIKNGKGGGNTKTGLIFEGETDLATFLNGQVGYRVDDGVVFYNNEEVARIFKKHRFYKYLEEVGVDWTKIISKKLLPDDSIYVIIDNTLFIIECKYQQVPGSVDEKLQTCDFKKSSIKN